MLAGDRVVLLHLNLFGRLPFVLGRRVKVTGSGRRNKLNDLAHFNP